MSIGTFWTGSAGGSPAVADGSSATFDFFDTIDTIDMWRASRSPLRTSHPRSPASLRLGVKMSQWTFWDSGALRYFAACAPLQKGLLSLRPHRQSVCFMRIS